MFKKIVNDRWIAYSNKIVPNNQNVGRLLYSKL